VPVVYLGFILMILGCFITFFKSHQRICVEIIRVGNSSRVMVAGSANKNKLGMQQKIKRISEKLQGMSQVNIPTTTNISRGQNE
jgi:cytochrome c biogenesis protein